MSRGTTISAVAHVGLILYLLIGPVFRGEAPEMEVADVTVLSEEDFAALTASRGSPEAETEQPQAPEPPAPEPVPEPEPTPAPEPEPVPEPAPVDSSIWLKPHGTTTAD